MKSDENAVDDAAAYSLHALDPEENERFEARAGRAEKDLAAEWALVGARLGKAVAPEEPPARLKENLMRQVAQTEQVDPSVPPEPAGSSKAPASGARSRARRRWGMVPVTVAAACAVLAVVAGVWGMDQKRQADETRSALSAAESESGSKTESPSILDQISSASDVSLAKGNMDGANISVMYSASHNMAGVSTSDMPPLPEGKVYMLWLLDKDHNVVGSGTLSGGTNDEGKNSGGDLTTMTDQDLSSVAAFGITVENGDAKAPTGDPFMLESDS